MSKYTKLKREPCLTNRKAVNIANDMGKRYTLGQAIMVGKEIGINWKKVKFKPADLMVGMHFELEHGKQDKRTNVTNDDIIKTAKIAWAHLIERPDCYVQLLKIDPPESEKEKAEKKAAVMYGLSLGNPYMEKTANYLHDIECKMCGYSGKPNRDGKCPVCYSIEGKMRPDLPIYGKEDPQPLNNGTNVEDEYTLDNMLENMTAY